MRETNEPDPSLRSLADISDETLIIHACRWKANHAESGNGSMSKAEIDDMRARAIRMGNAVVDLSERKPFTAHDAEYIRRLRAIAKRMETYPML